MGTGKGNWIRKGFDLGNRLHIQDNVGKRVSTTPWDFPFENL